MQKTIHAEGKPPIRTCSSPLIIVNTDIPMRLDKYLALVASSYGIPGRSALKARGGEAYANGKRIKLSAIVHTGDSIRVEWEEQSTQVMAEHIPLDIIYEDSNVTVVNKAQGMVTHPAAGHWNGTLVNALLGRWQYGAKHIEEGDISRQNIRTGIVHRLDKDTSGVIITARNDDALVWLQRQFRYRAVRKEYIAIVKGRPPAVAGIINRRIARDRHDRKKFAATNDRGRTAITIYHCMACYGQYSIMRLRLKTGRTHQIRVHLKSIGCPILGDPIYGPSRDGLFPDATLMLHSKVLEIRLPNYERRTLFTTPVPERFIAALHILKSKFNKEQLT